MNTIERIAFAGWQNNLRLSNGSIELVATLDVGPRIISLSAAGGPNVFKIFEAEAGGAGEADWKIRGGHRLWLAPEAQPFSYYPDNHAVQHQHIGELAVRLTPPPEKATGFAKEIDIALHPTLPEVTVTHRITNLSGQPHSVAPWALSVMAPGGTAIIPQPPLGQWPGDMLPQRVLVPWPYTDLTDPRWHLGRRFITLRQESTSGPTKLGLSHDQKWAGYLRAGTLFTKWFDLQPDAVYPDKGCNFETYTSQEFLELESLGPLQTLAAGQRAEHVERWRLATDVADLDATDDSAIEQMVARKVA